MSAPELLEYCRTLGVALKEEGCDLIVDDPTGIVSERLLKRLREDKPELIALLTAGGIEVKEAEDLREYFEERAGILEYDAGLPRPEAELEAARMTATYAQNKRYSWRALRAALEGCSELLARLPDADGPVDRLPLGVSRLAMLPGKRVVRQGVFSGEHGMRSGDRP